MVHDDITMMISKPKVWQRSHPFLSCRGESNFLDLSVICIFICIFLVSTSDTARTKTVNSTRVGLLLLSDNEYGNDNDKAAHNDGNHADDDDDDDDGDLYIIGAVP